MAKEKKIQIIIELEGKQVLLKDSQIYKLYYIQTKF